MFARFFRKTSSSVTFAALLIGGASLLSRLVGVFRDRLLSGTFGAGRELDVYYAAFRIPDLVYGMVVGGVITAGFIPVFTRYLGSHASPDKGLGESAERLADSLMVTLGLLLATGALLGAALAPQFVPAITPGFSSEDVMQAVLLTRIMMLSTFFLGLSNVFGGILQTKRRFATYSLAPILYNVGIVAGTAFLAPRFGIVGSAIGVVFGAFMHFVAQMIACADAGYRFLFPAGLKSAFGHDGVRQIAKLTVPRLASIGAGNVNALVVTGIASTLGAGSIAIYTLSNNLQLFPTMIIGSSFAIAAFPVISELAAKGKRAEFAGAVSNTTKNILFMIIPATVLMLLLRAQIVRVVLGTGQFDWADTIATADTLAFFSLSLFAQALWPLLARACFALEDVLSPLWAVIAGIVVERIAAWQMVSAGMGTPALALSFSLGSVVTIVWLWAALRHRAGASLGERGIIRAIFRTTIAALCMAITVQAAKTVLGNAFGTQTFLAIFGQGLGAGVVGLAVFIAAAYALGSEEAKSVVAMYSRKFAPVPVPELRQDDGTIEP